MFLVIFCAVNIVENFSWHHFALLRMNEIVVMSKNSRDFVLKNGMKSHFHWHLPNKNVFYIISNQMTILCGIYEIKIPFRLVISFEVENVMFRP